MAPNEQKSRSKGALGQLFLLFAIVIALFVAMKFLPVQHSLRDFNDWVGQMGVVGIFIFIAVYAVATVLLAPGAILTLGAGFAFGLWKGFLAVSAGSTLGAALAFLVARFIAREKIEAMAKGSEKFRRIDNAIGEQGATLVFLLRLSPVIPFTLSNYFYGLTAVKFWPYVLASWMGMMPGTFLYVYIGPAGRAAVSAAAGGEAMKHTWQYWTFIGVGFAATIVVTICVTKIARDALKKTADVKKRVKKVASRGWNNSNALVNGTEPKIEIFKPFGEAFELTKKILFQPFDFAKWLVIGFAAFLANLSGGLHFNVPTNWNRRHWRSFDTHDWDSAVDQLPHWVRDPIIIGIVVILSIALILIFWWLGARGRFIFTDCIVKDRGAIVAPWHEFRKEANSFFLFTLLISFLFMLTAGLLAIAVFVSLWLRHKAFTDFPGIVTITGAAFVGLILFLLSLAWALGWHFMVPVMYRRRCRAYA